MFKKVVDFTRPPQVRQDAPLPGRGRSERGGEAYLFSPAHPEPAETGSFPGLYHEPPNDARCARRGITRLTSAHGRETVSVQWKLAAFFNILKVTPV